jgi:hypothetical protein
MHTRGDSEALLGLDPGAQVFIEKKLRVEGSESERVALLDLFVLVVPRQRWGRRFGVQLEFTFLPRFTYLRFQAVEPAYTRQHGR